MWLVRRFVLATLYSFCGTAIGGINALLLYYALGHLGKQIYICMGCFVLYGGVAGWWSGWEEARSTELVGSRRASLLRNLPAIALFPPGFMVLFALILLLLPLMLVGVVVSLAMTIPKELFEFIQYCRRVREERSLYRRKLLAKGRLATLDELQTQLEAGLGTLIAVYSGSQISQLWWTADDLTELESYSTWSFSPRAEKGISDLDEMIAQAEHPFRVYCMQHYLSEDSGKGTRVCPPTDITVDLLAGWFPNIKLVSLPDCTAPEVSVQAYSRDTRQSSPPVVLLRIFGITAALAYTAFFYAKFTNPWVTIVAGALLLLAFRYVAWSISTSATVPLAARVLVIALLPLLPIVAAVCIVAVGGLVFLNLPLFMTSSFVGTWQYRRRFNKTGRYITLRKLGPRLEMGEGTLIVEMNLTDPRRIWWTEEDLFSLGKPVINDAEVRAVLSGEDQHEFNALCRRDYLDAETGKAVLTSIPVRHFRSGKLARKYPLMKIAQVVMSIESRGEAP